MCIFKWIFMLFCFWIQSASFVSFSYISGLYLSNLILFSLVHFLFSAFLFHLGVLPFGFGFSFYVLLDILFINEINVWQLHLFLLFGNCWCRMLMNFWTFCSTNLLTYWRKRHMLLKVMQKVHHHLKKFQMVPRLVRQMVLKKSRWWLGSIKIFR